MDGPDPREESLFEVALRLSPAERAAYLDSACEGDAGLRRRLDALLDAHDQAGGFLEVSRAAADRGDRIGRYHLLEQIGEGGCGVVYVAEQVEPVRRRVALKLIKLGMDTKQVIARFDAERQALALMDHPNIARVLDAGATEAGRPYFVMELVRGVKITDYCEEKQLSPRERLDLFGQVCRAIQHAHQKGIIHRDIKPSNILVTEQDGVPVPKVIDFGIAKATQGRLTDQTVYTAFEQFIGTPAYMSPEQAELSIVDIDTRTDIYSLGVLLYELLTGKTPFDARELLSAGLDAMRRTIREQEPPRPSTRLAQEMARAGLRRKDSELIHLLRGDLDWVAMKCLEKDRRRRYESASGLASDIQRHLDHEPVLARPPSALYRFQKLVRRNQLVAAAAGGTAVLVILALIALSVINVRVTRERNQKESALFLALRSQAQLRLQSRLMGQRFESLAALAEAARIRSEEGLRDDAIAAMALPDIARGPVLQGAYAGARGIAFDGLYRRYARVDEEGNISIRAVPGDQELQRLRSSATRRSWAAGSMLLFSPDGRLLAEVDARGRLQVWDWAEGRQVLREPPENCSPLAFSPDGRQLAAGQGPSVVCFDPATGLERNRWRARAKVNWLSFHPDNRKLAVGYYQDSTEVSVYDTGQGTLEGSLPIGDIGQIQVGWHPDGRRLAVTGADLRIQLWDSESGRKLLALEGHADLVSSISFHAGGGLLASGSWDLEERLWDPASGRQWLKVPFHASVHLSTDGRWFGYYRGGDDLQLLELAPGKEYRTLAAGQGGGGGFAYDAAVSPDGRLLAIAMDDAVRILELASGRELEVLPGQPKDPHWSVFFQPGGRELIACSHGAGLRRWSIERDSPAPGMLKVGPPRRIPVPFRPTRAAGSRDGRTLAAVGGLDGEALAIDLETDTACTPLMAHPRADFVSLSPDGRWMATGGWHAEEIRLWDARSGKLIHEWAGSTEQNNVTFTPDNRKLIICRADEIHFWDVETFQSGQVFRREVLLYPGKVSFSPDAMLMAMELAPGVIHIKETVTGRTLAKLSDPFGDRSICMVFAPGGTQLVVDASYAKVVHIWDLRAIRAGLKSMGLDWDWPEFPPAGDR